MEFVSLKVPETMKQKLKKIVELSTYITVSELVREAIREKIDSLELKEGKF